MKKKFRQREKRREEENCSETRERPLIKRQRKEDRNIKDRRDSSDPCSKMRKEISRISMHVGRR